MGGRGSSSGKGNGKTIYVRKGENVEDATKRYEEKGLEIRIIGRTRFDDGIEKRYEENKKFISEMTIPEKQKDIYMRELTELTQKYYDAVKVSEQKTGKLPTVQWTELSATERHEALLKTDDAKIDSFKASRTLYEFMEKRRKQQKNFDTQSAFKKAENQDKFQVTINGKTYYRKSRKSKWEEGTYREYLQKKKEQLQKKGAKKAMEQLGVKS